MEQLPLSIIVGVPEVASGLLIITIGPIRMLPIPSLYKLIPYLPAPRSRQLCRGLPLEYEAQDFEPSPLQWSVLPAPKYSALKVVVGLGDYLL